MKLPKAPKRTTPGFAFSIINRALDNCLGKRRFGKDEMREVLDFFGTAEPECVFCGSSAVRRWDHLVPVSQGGETVRGNMVPACGRCDDSKQHYSFEQWMTGDARWSPKSQGVNDIERRKDRIRAYVERFGYHVRPLEERLTKSELERLESIRSRLKVLRVDVDELIADYRKRPKSNREKPILLGD